MKYIVLCMALFSCGTLASADTAPCGPHDKMKAHIEKVGGRLILAGIAQAGQVLMELFYDPNDGTWVILMTGVDGGSCIATAGSNLEAIDIEPGGQDS